MARLVTGCGCVVGVGVGGIGVATSGGVLVGSCVALGTGLLVFCTMVGVLTTVAERVPVGDVALEQPANAALTKAQNNPVSSCFP
jgi:hypothetical protein